MEFKNEIGKLQRLVSASSAGISRRQAVLETLTIKPNDHIIDIGCGAGDLLIHLAKAVDNDGHIYGLDPSEDQITNANVKCAEFQNITFLKSTADKIDLPDKTCNLATSTQTFDYIKNVDEALMETKRILKLGASFVNISVLWDYFRFYGAEKKLNEKIHDAFKAHCSHQMLPMELPGKLSNLGFTNIKNKSLSFVITHRDQNSPAKYAEDVIAFFVKSQGISETEVNDWKEQINRAEKEGRFGFTSFPVLTEAFLNKI